MNEEHWKRYARLLVEVGVSLRPGQPLYVYGQVAHRRLIAYVTEAAYETGGGPVETRLFDPLQHAALLRHGRPEDVELVHIGLQAWLGDVVRHGGAYVCLQGPEIPCLFEELARAHPETYAAYRRGRAAAMSSLYRYGAIGRRFPWVSAACPTEGWARQVFPELPKAEAFDRLTELVFHFTFADREQALELAADRNRRLRARCRRLDELGITEIHVHGGGSDLRVGLSPEARWQGGSLETTAGQTFHPNVPSVEVFTTPDRRLAEGHLAVSRPFRLQSGPVVEGLVLRFRDGRVSDLKARSGQETFAKWLDTDEGTRRLGELALVGEDSPIARSGLFFDLELLDENASSHVALGSGHPWAFSGGESKSPRELEELGCNMSAEHLDVLFGSEQVTVAATRSREGEVVLLDRGSWTEPFQDC